jgi:hypothetical protein
MSFTFYVYEHWRLDKDECFYVGKGKNKRAYSANRNQHWKNIVAKLEREGSAWEVRIVASGLTEEQAFNIEIERIEFWKSKVDLSNKTGGGAGHSNPTKENREKLRAGKIGKPILDKITLKNNTLNLWKNPEYRAKQMAERKVRFTEEFREKLSNSHIGHKDSEETKLKKSESAKKAWAKRKEVGSCR